jgi:hypothetical protein
VKTTKASMSGATKRKIKEVQEASPQPTAKKAKTSR